MRTPTAPVLLPCPAWYSRARDHPYYDIDVPGRWVRPHTAAVSDKVSVQVLEDAGHHYRASVWVSEDIRQLSPAGAEQLASDLTTAAQLAERIGRRADRSPNTGSRSNS